jgi:hypothetical protein
LLCPLAPLPVSAGPCSLQLSPDRTNANTVPALLFAAGAPIKAVFPSLDMATLAPKFIASLWLPAMSSLCSDHPPPVRAYTHADPTFP